LRLRQTEQVFSHLWHRYSVGINLTATRRVPLVEQELLTNLDPQLPPQVCSGFGSVIWTDQKKKQRQCQVVMHSKGHFTSRRTDFLLDDCVISFFLMACIIFQEYWNLSNHTTLNNANDEYYYIYRQCQVVMHSKGHLLTNIYIRN
jgi:hypothetical protein